MIGLLALWATDIGLVAVGQVEMALSEVLIGGREELHDGIVVLSIRRLAVNDWKLNN